MGNRNAIGKKETENWETWLSHLSMDHFVQLIILYCVHLSLFIIIYLFICSSTHISTIRQVLKQDSKAYVH